MAPGAGIGGGGGGIQGYSGPWHAALGTRGSEGSGGGGGGTEAGAGLIVVLVVKSGRGGGAGRSVDVSIAASAGYSGKVNTFHPSGASSGERRLDTEGAWKVATT
jgi:hypothetical protein